MTGCGLMLTISNPLSSGQGHAYHKREFAKADFVRRRAWAGMGLFHRLQFP